MSLEALKRYFIQYKGGPGSGNWGHGGRPGKVGGSAPRSGMGAAMSIRTGAAAQARQLEARGAAYTNFTDAEMRKYYNNSEHCKQDPETCKEVRGFSSSGSYRVNHLLRGTKDSWWDGLDPDEVWPYDEQKRTWREIHRDNTQGWMDGMDKWIDDSPRTPANMIMYRQVKTDFAREHLQEGVVFQDKGYAFTTLRHGGALREDAEESAAVFGAARIELRVPEGSKAAYLPGGASKKRGEQEFVLPRGSKFRVLSNRASADEWLDRELIVELVNG